MSLKSGNFPLIELKNTSIINNLLNILGKVADFSGIVRKFAAEFLKYVFDEKIISSSFAANGSSNTIGFMPKFR